MACTRLPIQWQCYPDGPARSVASTERSSHGERSASFWHNAQCTASDVFGMFQRKNFRSVNFDFTFDSCAGSAVIQWWTAFSRSSCSLRCWASACASPSGRFAARSSGANTSCGGGTTREPTRQRTESITRVLLTAVRAIWGLLAIILVLGSFGVNLGAILASVSLISIALGFGAQYLVRDYLSGC